MAIQQSESPFEPTGQWQLGSEGLLLPQHISDYQITNIGRLSLKDPEVTETGAHIYQELCTFEDSQGHTVIREATFGIPNSNVVETVPNPLVATDPWTTGKRGLNRIKLREAVDMGYPVIWLHHGDQRSPLQRNKSITRSARQAHALLDDLETNSDFSTQIVIPDGYSRGGMTGEKFIALAPQHLRTVLFSLFDAPCFAADMSLKEKWEVMLKQLPKEVKGVGSLAVRYFKHGLEQLDFSDLAEMALTFNPHPKNIIQEIMWIRALTHANVGQIIDHQPVDTKGIRNFFEYDEISQIASYVDLYARLTGVIVVAHDGPHVEGASPEYIYEVRRAQLSQLKKTILSGESINAEQIAQKAELDLRKLKVLN